MLVVSVLGRRRWLPTLADSGGRWSRCRGLAGLRLGGPGSGL